MWAHCGMRLKESSLIFAHHRNEREFHVPYNTEKMPGKSNGKKTQWVKHCTIIIRKTNQTLISSSVIPTVGRRLVMGTERKGNSFGDEISWYLFITRSSVLVFPGITSLKQCLVLPCGGHWLSERGCGGSVCVFTFHNYSPQSYWLFLFIPFHRRPAIICRV